MNSYELRFTDADNPIATGCSVRFYGDAFPMRALRAMRDGLLREGFADAQIVDTTPGEQVIP